MDVREKGHRFERYVVSIFKTIGFSKAISTRAFNKVLDGCSVDIARIPYYIQCKSGYIRGLNYSKIFETMKRKLTEVYDKVEYPLIIMHKKSSKYEENLVIMPFDDFIKLINDYEQLKQDYARTKL